MCALFAVCLLCVLGLGHGGVEDAPIGRSITKELYVIPEVIKEPPQELLKLHFENGIDIEENKAYAPGELEFPPKLEWNADAESYYTIVMLCPDAPSRELPIYRSWIHWLVVNVPGLQVDKGQTISEYFGPVPPRDSGLLRFVALVYRQSGKLEVDEKKLDMNSAEDHSNFDLERFTNKYELDAPYAGNIFQCEWDEYVRQKLKVLYNVDDEAAAQRVFV